MPPIKIKRCNNLHIDNRLTQLFSIFYNNTANRTICRNAGFLIAIMMFFAINSIPAYAEPTIETDHYGNYLLTDIQPIDPPILNLIPSDYAVSMIDPNKQNKKTDNQYIDLYDDETYFSSNELLVKIKTSSKNAIKKNPKPEDTGIISLNQLNKKHAASKFEKVVKLGSKSKKDSPLFNWYKITLNAPNKKITKKSAEYGKLKDIMTSYSLDPNIEVVEQDTIINILSTPNDPYYSSSGSWGQSYPDLWGIQTINSESAWDRTTGSSLIVVADIDTGVDRNHEDLQDNMWVNINEIPNNGMDDDTNGYIDDYYGWDWVNNDNDPMDDHGHGTHTAGTIAATGNNGLGVVGVNWNSRIMALKFLNSGGSGYLSDGVKALQYAADMGARVSSNSWGSSGSNAMLEDAIQYEHDMGMVVVVAAGNSNADALDSTPASADMAITVAASDHNDAKASFSNWGQKIDVAAPGVNILSAKASLNNMCTAAKGNIIGTKYCVVSGTSMATPHVAGLAALILANDPSLTNEEVRQMIRAGAVDLGSQGKDSDFGFGRIDAYGSISLSDTNPLAPIITSPRSRTVVYGQALQIKGDVSGPNFASYNIEAGAGRDPSVWTTLATSTSQVINGTLGTIDTTQLINGFYIFRLIATDTHGNTYQFQIHDIEVDNFDISITSPVTLVPQENIDILGSAQTKNGLSLDHYTLEWGEGSSPVAYSTSGISLVDNGLQPVSNSRLATWDTSSLNAGHIYTLRLTITASSGAISTYTTEVTVDQDLVKGWPRLISRSPDCNICEATPTIIDLDNDGAMEVIITSPDNMIYVFRKDGSDFPGFPISVTSGERFTWPANVADLDNDGDYEILAASTTSSGGSKVYIVRSDGTFYPGWPNPVHTIPQEAGDGTPTIADLNGDGNKDMVVIDPYYKKIHAYQLDGSELAGFPKILPFNNLEYPGAPSISDMDNDGLSEIAYGLGDTFYIFDNEGNVLPGWPFVAPAYNGYAIKFHSSAAYGDIDGDGNLEILAIGHNSGSCGSAITPIYAWKKDGSLVPGWPRDGGNLCNSYSPLNSPSVADVDNDGRDEAVVGLYALSVFDLEGKKPIGDAIGAETAPAISDVNGDGRFEFLGTRYNRIQIGNDDGTIRWQRVFSTNTRFLTPAAFSDLDNNGRVELSVVQRRHPNEPGDLIAYLWEMPETSSHETNSWPMFLHDPQRSGRLIVSEPVLDTTAPMTSITSPADNSAVSGTVDVNVAASDNTGVSKVELYRNGNLVSTKTSSPYAFSWNTTQEVNEAYAIMSKAYDAANNVGTSSTITVQVSNTVDNTAPMTSITTPSDNSVVSGTVNVNVAAFDNTGVSKVELYRNGNLVSTKTSSPYTFSWDTTQEVNEAAYPIMSKAYDAANNVGTSSTITVQVSNRVDNTAPTVSITYPSDNTDVQRKSKLVISATALDNVGVTKVEFYINGILECIDTTASYACNWKVPAKPGQTYAIQAYAYDAKGNVGSSASYKVTSA